MALEEAKEIAESAVPLAWIATTIGGLLWGYYALTGQFFLPTFAEDQVAIAVYWLIGASGVLATADDLGLLDYSDSVIGD